MDISVPEQGQMFIRYNMVSDASDPTNMAVSVIPPKEGDREMERTILIEGTLPPDRGVRIYF